jgi:inositol phosphorylceramide mannosyltransferase catalytic subunit
MCMFFVLLALCCTSIQQVAYAQLTTLYERYPIDFYEAMSHSAHFNRSIAEKNLEWQLVVRLYKQGMRTSFDPQGAPRIPCIFHLIWLGSPVPRGYRLLVKRLKELHPTWRVKLWTDADVVDGSIAGIPLVNHTAFTWATNYGEKSDILRYEILARYGGIYMDGDFDVRRPFHDLVCSCSFFTGLAYNSSVEVYNGLVGCTPGHPIIQRCITTLHQEDPGDDSDAIIWRTGPLHFTRCFLAEMQKNPASRAIAFPVAFFYPWPNYERLNKDPLAFEHWVQPYSFTVHKWACSWITKTAE